MCGITGIIGKEDKDLIKKMTFTIQHRGPDQEGYYTDKNISLGFRRLAILDLSKNGSQPMFNENKDLILTFNVEIYNFKEIKNKLNNHNFISETDTEVILHGYEEYKENILKHLNGMFAFCIYNKHTKQCFLARDRIGIKPLYYTIIDNILYFSSELKSLLIIPELKKEINPDAINEFLTLRHINGPKTIIKNIYKLQPGHYITFPKLKIKKYWEIKQNITNFNEDYYTKRLERLLNQSVKMQLISDVPLGIFLSGGLDSSIITALMSKHSQEIKSFSISFSQYNNQETKNALLVSELFNTNHKEISVYPEDINLLNKIIYHLDEPTADPAAIPTYILAQKSRKNITVTLVGEGADEIFGGYEQYKILKLKQYLNYIPGKNILPILIKKSPKKVLNYFFKYSESLGEKGIERFSDLIKTNNLTKNYLSLTSFFDQKEKKLAYSPELISKLKENTLKNINIKKDKEFLNNIMCFETKTEMVDCLLMKVDKMTMAHSMDARVPYLDHNIVDFAFTIPQKYKNSKYILKKTAKNLLPKTIISTKKQRFFVPIDKWFENELKDYKNNFLEENILIERKIINKNYFFSINNISHHILSHYSIFH